MQWRSYGASQLRCHRSYVWGDRESCLCLEEGKNTQLRKVLWLELVAGEWHDLGLETLGFPKSGLEPLHHCSQSVAPGQAAREFPWNLLKMQILSLHPSGYRSRDFARVIQPFVLDSDINEIWDPQLVKIILPSPLGTNTIFFRLQVY